MATLPTRRPAGRNAAVTGDVPAGSAGRALPRAVGLIAAVGLAGSMALAVSGCGAHPNGAAATVNGQVITTRALQEVSDQLIDGGAIQGPATAELAAQLATLTIQEAFLEEAWTAIGQPVPTDEEAEAAWLSVIGASGDSGAPDGRALDAAAPPKVNSVGLDIGRRAVILTQLQSGLMSDEDLMAFDEQIGLLMDNPDYDIWVSPRLGAFDRQSLGVVADLAPWFVDAAANLA